MKNLTIILLFILIPLVVMSRAFDFSHAKFRNVIPGNKFIDRTWRLNEVLEEQNQMDQWEETGKFFYVYDTVHTTRLDTLKYCVWHSDTNDWIPVMMIGFTYEATNEYVTHEYATWRDSVAFHPFMRANYSYDNQHRFISQFIEFYNQDLDVWSMGFWTQIIYVSNTNYQVYNYNSANDEDPEQWSKLNFTWDGQGRIITETEMTSPDSINWSNSGRTTRTYHPNDTTTGDSFVSSIAHSLPFENLFGFNPRPSMFGMVSEELLEAWVDPDWINDEQVIYTYNANDKLISTVRKFWVTDVSMWFDDSQDINIYDTNNNLYQVTESWWDGTQWIQNSRYTCTWGQDTAIDDNTTPSYNGLSLNVSPNPFRSEVTISVNCKNTQPVKLFVYNTKGQLVSSFSAQPNTTVTWDGKDLASRSVTDGVYFIKAVSGGASQTIKVLKLK